MHIRTEIERNKKKEILKNICYLYLTTSNFFHLQNFIKNANYEYFVANLKSVSINHLHAPLPPPHTHSLSTSALQTEVALAMDAVELFARALDDFFDGGEDSLDIAQLACDRVKTWRHGSTLRNYMLAVSFFPVQLLVLLLLSLVLSMI